MWCWFLFANKTHPNLLYHIGASTVVEVLKVGKFGNEPDTSLSVASLTWRDQRSRPPSAAGIALPLACTQPFTTRYPNTLRGRPARLSPPFRPLPRQRRDATCPALPPSLSPPASLSLLPTAPPAPPQPRHPQPRTPNLINTGGPPRSSRVSEGKRALTHSAARGQSPPRGPPRILRQRPPHLLEPTTPHLLGKLGVGPTSRR